jgi:hypothetical protein
MGGKNMKFKTVIRYSCAGLLVGACAIANAVAVPAPASISHNLGALSAPLNSDTVKIVSSFDDTFTFIAASAPGAFSSWTGGVIKGSLTGNYSFGTGTTILKQGTFEAITSGSGTFGFATTFSDLQARTQYWLHLVGSSNANADAGSYSVTLAPVPEPEVIAMLLAGLALVGTIVRRRSSDSKLRIGSLK